MWVVLKHESPPSQSKFTVDKVQGQATMALVKGIGLFVIIGMVT